MLAAVCIEPRDAWINFRRRRGGRPPPPPPEPVLGLAEGKTRGAVPLPRFAGEEPGSRPTAPMIITEAELNELFDRLAKALDDTEAWVAKEALRAA